MAAKKLAKKGLGTRRPQSLLAMALRHLPGGWRRSLEYADHAAKDGDPQMQRLLKCYADLTARERQAVTLEHLCDLAGILPADFFGRIASIAYELGQHAANLIAGAHHPEVVATTIRNAKKPGGFRDREALLKHSGFVPVPRGSRINIGFQTNIEAPARPASLRPFEEETLHLTRVLRDEEGGALVPSRSG